MNCREFVEMLIDYVAGELPPELQEHIRRHLELCPPCVTYLETYQITIRLTRKLPDAPVPATLMERLEASLKEMKDGSGDCAASRAP